MRQTVVEKIMNRGLYVWTRITQEPRAVDASVPISVGASLRGRPQVRKQGAPTEGRPYNFLKLGHYPVDDQFVEANVDTH